MIVAGIDIGSGRTKVILLNEAKHVCGSASQKTSGNLAVTAENALNSAVQTAGAHRQDVVYIATTGLGRYNVPFRDIQITEITCAARGAKFLFPDAHCVLDIGSQSTRAIRLRENGKVQQFRSNDRCAAGSGGFLERAARYLEIGIEEVGALSLKAHNSQTISSVCAVLAESEIINHVSAGSPVEDILRGIHDSLAERAAALLKRVRMEAPVVFVGGVARQSGMVQSLRARLQTTVYVDSQPEFVCAIGAAVLGWQRLQRLIESQQQTIQSAR